MTKKPKAHEPDSMGDATPFVAEITRQADEEIEKILSRAKRTAETRLDETRKQARAETDSILETARQRAEIERRRILSDLSLETKKLSLKARGELVEEVLGQIRVRLERTRGTPEYRAMLKECVIEGIEALDRDAVSISVSPADAAIVNEAFLVEVAAACKRSVKITPKVDLDTNAMGVIVRALDGSVLFDNTIAARMDRLGDELSLIVSHEVFARESNEP